MRDLAEPPNSRIYLIAGTQHGGAAGSPSTPGACANPRNPHNPSPVLRALIVALEDWVVKGIAPPPAVPQSVAQARQPQPFADLRAICRVRTATLYQRLAAMTNAGRIAKSADGYRLVG